VLDQSQNMRVPQVSSNLSKPALLEMRPLLVAGIDLVVSIIGVRYHCKVFFFNFVMQPQVWRSSRRGIVGQIWLQFREESRKF